MAPVSETRVLGLKREGTWPILQISATSLNQNGFFQHSRFTLSASQVTLKNSKAHCAGVNRRRSMLELDSIQPATAKTGQN